MKVRVNQKEDNGLDILKYIGSLFVIAIYLNFLGEKNILLYPWMGFAVPSFFIISGYLLTMKLLKDTNYFFVGLRRIIFNT